MGSYYPVFLRLEGRRCVVVGGGVVAQGKVAGLLECGASVAVVSPDLTPALAQLAREGRIAWEARPYRRGDLAGAFLAIAATDEPGVNQEVAREAEERGVLLNVVDVPSLCTFIAPAVVRRGPVTVAISTGGLSPALARRLRRAMEDDGSCGCLAWADMAPLVAEVRQDLRRQGVAVASERWQEALTPALLGLFRAGRREEARARLRRALLGQGQEGEG